MTCNANIYMMAVSDIFILSFPIDVNTLEFEAALNYR